MRRYWYWRLWEDLINWLTGKEPKKKPKRKR